MNLEIKNALDTLGRDWEAFKYADRREKSDIFDRINRAEKAAEFASSKAGRMLSGSGGSAISHDAAMHAKGYNDFLRKGHDIGLRELEAKALSIGTSADGGYALPEQIDRQVQAKIVTISPIRSIAKVVQVSTNDYKRLIDVRGTASGWVGETTARTATNTPQLFEAAAFMGEIYANATATQMSLDDIYFDAEAWIADSIGTEFARAEGASFISGNGTNQPKGFTAYTTAATADSSRAFGTIEHVPTGVSGAWPATDPGIYDLLVQTVYKLKAAHRQNAKWVMPASVCERLRKLKDGQNQPIWQPNMAADRPNLLLGYEVVEAEDMPAIAANSLSVAFGNFDAGYCIVDRVGTRLLRDPYTNKPNVQFYATKR
ncbi:MAG: hypothetical protein RLZZ200_652, partial [Pseudomonadota bacterium]